MGQLKHLYLPGNREFPRCQALHTRSGEVVAASIELTNRATRNRQETQ